MDDKLNDTAPQGDKVPEGDNIPEGDDIPEGEKVECHSGYEYAERPVALRWEGQRLAIRAIEAQWRIPGGKKFRVQVEDGRIFEIFYGELYSDWRIHQL